MAANHGVTVRHNFETAHRLPHLPGKCQSLHGHSWWAEVTVEAPELPADGILVEFGPFKKLLREWIDTHLDHGVMLGPDDPLLPILKEHGCKVRQVFPWPTVENVALMVALAAQYVLQDRVPHASGARLTRVHIQETHVNAATWTAQ
jgi:6-pyruvoyltetrahydropterin/6-carboxytetrahydropterin synthase